MASVARLPIFKMYRKTHFLDQAELIEKLQSGDRSVFGSIVTMWQDMVYNTALGIVQNEQDAEEITQDVFIKLHEAFGYFRGDAKLSTWIYKITISKALDAEKNKKRQKRGGLLKRIFNTAAEEEPVSLEHPGIALDKKEDAKVLFSAINKLSEKQRLAFLLHKLEGLDQEEIAAVMDTSVTAVESLQARAKSNLRTILKDYYENNFK